MNQVEILELKSRILDILEIKKQVHNFGGTSWGAHWAKQGEKHFHFFITGALKQNIRPSQLMLRSFAFETLGTNFFLYANLAHDTQTRWVSCVSFHKQLLSSLGLSLPWAKQSINPVPSTT